MLWSTNDFLLRAGDHRLLRARDDLLLRSKLLVRLRVHRRIRSHVLVVLRTEQLLNLLRANVPVLLQRRLVSRLLVGSIYFERVGYADNVCRVVSDELRSWVRTDILLRRLRSELPDVLQLLDLRFVCACTYLLDMHRLVRPRLQHVRWRLCRVVRSGSDLLDLF